MPTSPPHQVDVHQAPQPRTIRQLCISLLLTFYQLQERRHRCEQVFNYGRCKKCRQRLDKKWIKSTRELTKYAQVLSDCAVLYLRYPARAGRTTSHDKLALQGIPQGLDGIVSVETGSKSQSRGQIQLWTRRFWDDQFTDF